MFIFQYKDHRSDQVHFRLLLDHALIFFFAYDVSTILCHFTCSFSFVKGHEFDSMIRKDCCWKDSQNRSYCFEIWAITNQSNATTRVICKICHKSSKADPKQHHFICFSNIFHILLLTIFAQSYIILAIRSLWMLKVLFAALHVLLVTCLLLCLTVCHNQIINPMLNNSNQVIQNELLQLFNSIKVDKSKEAAIEKSTLISLLIYHHVDAQYPEYFRYVSRALQKFKKTTVTQEEFLKIFMNPDIDMGMADKNELADAFGILDSKKTGSIDVKEFLQAYRMSENYQQLPEQKKRQAEDQIKEAFYSASQDGKITPMDFYHIVKFR